MVGCCYQIMESRRMTASIAIREEAERLELRWDDMFIGKIDESLCARLRQRFKRPPLSFSAAKSLAPMAPTIDLDLHLTCQSEQWSSIATTKKVLSKLKHWNQSLSHPQELWQMTSKQQQQKKKKTCGKKTARKKNLQKVTLSTTGWKKEGKM